jgi:hypothetical protein
MERNDWIRSESQLPAKSGKYLVKIEAFDYGGKPFITVRPSVYNSVSKTWETRVYPMEQIIPNKIIEWQNMDEEDNDEKKN